MSSVTVQPDDTNAGFARALYILAVACFPVLLAGFITLLVFVTGAVQRGDGIGHSTQFAQFEYPVPGGLVRDEFELRGTIKSIPQGGTVYLVELSEGRYWPKKMLGDAPKSFTRRQVISAGKGYKYTVVLLSVGKAGDAQIESWFDHGRKTGKYPGITSFEGSTTLAKIRVIRQ